MDEEDDTGAPAAGVDDDLERVEDIVVDLLLPLSLLCFGFLATRSWTTTDAPTRSRGKVSGGCSRSELLPQRGPR